MATSRFGFDDTTTAFVLAPLDKATVTSPSAFVLSTFQDVVGRQNPPSSTATTPVRMTSLSCATPDILCVWDTRRN
jgi:hypothetical protein